MDQDCKSKFIPASITSPVCASTLQCLMYQIFIVQKFQMTELLSNELCSVQTEYVQLPAHTNTRLFKLIELCSVQTEYVQLPAHTNTRLFKLIFFILRVETDKPFVLQLLKSLLHQPQKMHECELKSNYQ